MALYRENGEKRERPSLRSLRYQAPDLDNKKLEDARSYEEIDTKSSYPSLSSSISTLEKKELIRKESLRKENGPRDYPDGNSLSSTTPPLPAPKPLLGSTGRYVPLSERKGLSGLSGDTPSMNSNSTSSNGKGLSGLSSDSFNRLNSRRAEMREAYFKSDVTGPKLDSIKTEKDNKDKYSSSLSMSSVSSISSSLNQQNSGVKENIIEGYVGFANLPNQVYRKAVKRGFEFTLMVVGESGLGKSTLINSMFLSDLYSGDYPGPSHRIKKTVQVESTQCVLKENGVQLRLTVVDTPGFGDAVDNSNCWEPVIQFIEAKYEEYLNAESRVNRKTNPDSRPHCCLYFISPNGHGLKPLDVEFMKRLHDKVNIIPLIAKADTLTPDECREFKKTILNEIAQHKIKIYEFPDCDDEEENKAQKKLKDRVPFAVVGSNTVVDSQGRKVRGRIYPWGVVEVENLEHNDFIALRNMLIRTHMQDLKDVTNNVHYENFRFNNLAQVSSSGKSVKPAFVGKNPLLIMEEEKKEHALKMKKMEAEMEQVFEMKVKEKKQKLKDSEVDLQRQAEKMKKFIEQEQKKLEERWAVFQKEQETWEEQQRQMEEARRRSLEKDTKQKKKLF